VGRVVLGRVVREPILYPFYSSRSHTMAKSKSALPTGQTTVLLMTRGSLPLSQSAVPRDGRSSLKATAGLQNWTSPIPQFSFVPIFLIFLSEVFPTRVVNDLYS
jgi:hypothetical protein